MSDGVALSRQGAGKSRQVGGSRGGFASSGKGSPPPLRPNNSSNLTRHCWVGEHRTVAAACRTGQSAQDKIWSSVLSGSCKRIGLGYIWSLSLRVLSVCPLGISHGKVPWSLLDASDRQVDSRRSDGEVLLHNHPRQNEPRAASGGWVQI